MIELLNQAFFVQHPALPFLALGLSCIAYTPWAKLLNLARRYQLTTFFTLTLGLTWAAFIPYYNSYHAGEDGIPWFTFGPMVAGFVMAGVTGGFMAVKSIAASVVRWKVHPIWYAAAIGVPFGAQFVSALLNPLFGSAAPAWGNIPPIMEILPMILIFAIFSGPLGEEIGWRGFALPRLLETRSATSASLILGSVWAIWHLPLALVGDFTTYGAFMPIIAAFAFTWVSQNARGSVLLAILMHVSHQNSVRFLGKVFTESDHVQQQWLGAGIWLIVIAAILLIHGTKNFMRQAETRVELAVQA
jgi:uncharacterized protein